MKSRTELISLIQHRDKLNEDELVLYMDEITKIIGTIVRSPLFYHYYGSDMASREAFEMQCWNLLEGTEDDSDGPGGQGGIIQLLVEKSVTQFSNNGMLTAYLKKSFENRLLEIESKKRPEYTSRKKQVDRVLKTFCYKLPIEKQGHENRREAVWILKSKLNPMGSCPGEKRAPAYADNALFLPECFNEKIPDSDTIRALAVKISMPEKRYCRQKSAHRGPKIKDQDMARYLETLMTKAGGLIHVSDLDERIREIAAAPPLQHFSVDAPPKDETGIPLAEKKIHEKQAFELMPSPDHLIFADEILKQMPGHLKNMIDCLYIQGMRQGEAAKKLGVSGGKMTNMKGELIHFMQHAIMGDGPTMSREEGEIVFRLIIDRIKEIKENSTLVDDPSRTSPSSPLSISGEGENIEKRVSLNENHEQVK